MGEHSASARGGAPGCLRRAVCGQQGAHAAVQQRPDGVRLLQHSAQRAGADVARRRRLRLDNLHVRGLSGQAAARRVCTHQHEKHARLDLQKGVPVLRGGHALQRRSRAREDARHAHQRLHQAHRRLGRSRRRQRLPQRAQRAPRAAPAAARARRRRGRTRAPSPAPRPLARRAVCRRQTPAHGASEPTRSERGCRQLELTCSIAFRVRRRCAQRRGCIAFAAAITARPGCTAYGGARRLWRCTGRRARAAAPGLARRRHFRVRSCSASPGPDRRRRKRWEAPRCGRGAAHAWQLAHLRCRRALGPSRPSTRRARWRAAVGVCAR